ncbi:MAG: hypothetical protein AAFR33_04505 [Pseudomonadota bacterium]
MRHGFKAVVAGFAALVGAFGIAAAATPAGTVIRNQAQATYFDPAKDRSYEVTSSIATVQVSLTANFELLTETQRLASPMELVQLPHLLRNTGNQADRYRLETSALDGIALPDSIAIIHDLNENGVADTNEPRLSQTDTLLPGQAIAIVVTARVPDTALPAAQFALRLDAASELDPDLARSRTDTIEVLPERQFSISKNAFPACAVPIGAGSMINYELDMVNLDQLAPFVREVYIDGALRRGLLIEDTVPANTELVLSDGEAPSPAGSLRLVQGAQDGETWRSYAGASASLRPVVVAHFVPESLLTPGQSASFTFDVRVNDDITPGTVITNQITADIDGDGSVDAVSNETCNSVAPGGAGANQAQLRFLEPSQLIRRASLGLAPPPTQSTDASGAIPVAPRHPVDTDYRDAPVYRLDTFPGYVLSRDGVYLEARSNSLNISAAISDNQFDQRFIRVQVESRETGDTVLVNLLETGPNTGLFRAEVAFRLSEIDRGQGRACSPQAQENCVLQSVSGDRLRATIYDPGTQAVLIDTAVVDPLGVVFDSTSMAAVPGAEVTIRNGDGSVAIDPDTGAPHPVQVTDTTGTYVIPRLDGELYYVDVTPPADYAFPSAVSETVFAGRRIVDGRSYGRNGFSGPLDAGLFTASFENGPPVIDIPLDPDLSLGQLSLEKVAGRETVQFGDTVGYTLAVQNNTNAVLLDASITDAPAPGLRLLEDTVRLDGVVLETVRGPGRAVTFPIGRLEIGETKSITYRMQVGADARSGDAVNVALAEAVTGGGVPARSFRARESVTVSDQGLFSDRAYLIGSVWADADGDGLRDEDEIGLPGARIWLEDGTWVETDELGRFSLYGLKPGMRVARIDPETLVSGFLPGEHTARQAGGGKSRFVDLIAGELHRADFPLACMADEPCGVDSRFQRLAAERAARLSPDAMLDQALAYEGLIGETVSRDLSRLREQPGPDGDISSGQLSLSGTSILPGNPATTQADAPATAPAPEDELDPEILASRLGRVDISVGQWLWPLPDAETGVAYSRDGRFMAAIRPGMEPQLFVNGEEQSPETLGAIVENREVGAQVAAWYGIELEPGTHTVEVRAQDMFGNLRTLASTEVTRPGAATQLVIDTIGPETAADGLSTAQFVLRALDGNGAPALGRHFITVTAGFEGRDEPLSFRGQDVQPAVPGFQVRLDDGAAVLGLRAPDRPGSARIAASNDGELSAETVYVFETVARDLMAIGVVDLTAQGFDLSGDLEPADSEVFPESFETDGRVAFFLKGRVRGDVLLTAAYDSEASRRDGLFRDIDPEAYYPIYGDASERGFEAQSRSNLYVRLDKGVHSAMFGDFRTDVFGGEALTRIRRALTGVNLFTGGEDWVLQGFAAEADSTSRTERIRGRGLALDIALPGAPLVANSETLTIETRFKDTPGLVASETPLVRFADYILDDETGQLTLKAPIPSFDEFGNPVFLRATYETRGDETGDLVAGLRFEHVDNGRRVFAGFNFDESEAGLDDRTSASIGVEQTIAAGVIYAEIGGMDVHDEFGTNEFDNAVRLGADVAVAGGQLTVEAAQAGLAYDNPDAPILAGRREARAEYAVLLDQVTGVSLMASHSLDIETDNGRSIVEGRVERQIGDWSLAAGPRHVSQDTTDQMNDYTAGVVRVGRDVRIGQRSGSAFAELESAFSDVGTRFTLGADALVHDSTRVYAAHRVIDELPEQTFVSGLTSSQSDISQGRTLLGVEAGILPATDVYGEWRQGGSLDNGTGEAAYGIRAQWELAEGVSIAPQLEITEVFDDGANAAAVQDTAAVSVALADRRSSRSRRSLRVEARTSANSTFYAMRSAWAQRFTPELSGAIKLDGARDNIFNAPDTERIRATIGLARRPADHKATDLFTLYQWNREQSGGQDRDVHIVSAHANRQFGTDWTLAGRAAAKWEAGQAYDATAQLASVRVIHEINRSWDAELRGALRTVGWGDSEETSLGSAIAWKPHEDVRLALGYNAIGFRDRDLDPGRYSAKGVFTQVSIMIDETWFGWLKPSE